MHQKNGSHCRGLASLLDTERFFFPAIVTSMVLAVDFDQDFSGGKITSGQNSESGLCVEDPLINDAWA